MKIEGAVALVTGANRGVGAAMVHALLARGAARVYAPTRDAGSEQQLGSVPVQLDAARRAQLKALARELGDVSLLVNHVVLVEPGPFSMAGADDAVADLQQTPAGRCLQFIDAFAPVLAANGGGAVVNVVSVSSTGAHWYPSESDGGSQSVDCALSEGSRSRLAAQRTQLLCFHAALVDPGSDDVPRGQRTVADHLAWRVLDWLEAGDGAARIGRPARLR